MLHSSYQFSLLHAALIVLFALEACTLARGGGVISCTTLKLLVLSVATKKFLNVIAQAFPEL